MFAQNIRTHNNLFSLNIFSILSFFILIFTGFFIYSNSQSSNTSSVDSQFAEYSDQNSNFSIKYPSDWLVSGGNDKAGVTTINSIPEKSKTTGGLIDPGTYQENLENSMENFSKVDILRIEVTPGTSAFEFLKSRSELGVVGQVSPLIIDGLNAIRVDVDMSATMQNHTESKIYTSVFLTNENNGYIIAGFANSEVLNKIIYSFRAL